jgi:hypothetical protein
MHAATATNNDSIGSGSSGAYENSKIIVVIGCYYYNNTSSNNLNKPIQNGVRMAQLQQLSYVWCYIHVSMGQGMFIFYEVSLYNMSFNIQTFILFYWYIT